MQHVMVGGRIGLCCAEMAGTGHHAAWDGGSGG